MTGIGEYTFCGCSGLTSVTIPNSVTSIGGEAFSNCSGLTSVTIGNSVKSIGDWAFASCSGLTSVTIGNSVKSIGNAAFYGCSGLTEVTIPNSVTSIGGDAFRGCSGLTAVTIPGSVTSMGSGAFVGCSGITLVKVTVTDYASLNKAVGLIYSNIGKPVQLIDGDGTEIKEYVVPEGVTTISSNAFINCTGLTAVTIPGSVTSMGSGAFSGCSGITLVKVTVTDYASFCENKAVGLIYSNIGKPVQLIDGDGTEIKEYVVPEGVTTISSGAFRNCTGLTSVTIPNSVTSIGNSAFSLCSGLTSVTIGSGVTSIGNYAFRDCSGITLVKVPVTDYASFCENKAVGLIYSNIGKPVQLIDGDATEIKEYVVPEGVTSIGSSAFINCTGLTSVTFPNSVTSIGDYAFNRCSGLTSVTIPGSVTSIGDYAFSGCTSIMSVKSFIAEPFNVTGLFANETYRQGTLYVPAGTKDLYIRYDGWREFLKIEEVGAEPAPNGQCAKPTIIIAGKGMRYECETPGAEYESILTTEEQRFTGNKLVMDNKDLVYILTVYATAPGYDRSEPAQVKFVVSRNDVNQDGVVNVADIATIIGAMAAQARMQEEVEE